MYYEDVIGSYIGTYWLHMGSLESIFVGFSAVFFSIAEIVIFGRDTYPVAN